MFTKHMRKVKQEITDPSEIEEILQSAEVCRLAMSHNGIPYIVPLNYGYEEGTLYFHCAATGLKIDILRENDLVCFEVESHVKLITSEIPCDWSQYYRSVIGWGKAELITDPDERRKALVILMNHYEERDWEIPEAKIDRTMVIRVRIDHMTGKRDGN